MAVRHLLLCTGALIAAGAAAPQAYAQSKSAPGVGEVIVTAQKREQRLQDVPVVVTVLNTQQLQNAGVKDIRDLTVLTPGLNATTNATEATTTVRIRGVGTAADNSGLEDGVGIYIDNVYRPRNGVSFNDLGELSDIEVLKGPQGTVFGKNTVAGVVQITTKRPSFNFEAGAEATIQNYSGAGGSAYVTGPIVDDKVAARLYVAVRERGGYIPVVQPAGTPKIPNQDDEHMVTTRDQLLFTPNPDFDLNIIGDYTTRNDHCCVAVEFQAGLPATILNLLFPGTAPLAPDANHPVAYLNHDLQEHIREGGISAETHWRTPWFNNATLTTITAWRDWTDHAGADVDVTGADLLDAEAPHNSTAFKQFSEEVRYNGETKRLVWQVGAFFDAEALDQEIFLPFGTQLGAYLNALSPLLPPTFYPAGEGTDDFWRQREHSESVYTQDELKVTDQLSIIGGVRYTSETKTLHTIWTNNDTVHFCQIATGGAPFSAYQLFPKSALALPCLINPAFAALGHANQSFTEGAWTGTAKLQYRFSPTAMAYASYSRGNLVGGYNLAEVTLPFAGGAPNSSLAPDTDVSFPAEWVDAYEAGAKTQFFDRRLSLNGALFYQIYENYQLNAYTGTQFVEDTIPRAITRGAELEAYVAATPELTLNGGVTYADTFYPNSAANIAALTSNGNPLFRLPGSHLSFAPLWSITGGISYTHPITSMLNVLFVLDGKYTSSYNTGSDHDPVKLQPGFALFDGRIGISTHDGKLALEVWSTNLFDKRYKLTAYDGVLQTFSVPAPSSVPALNDYMMFPAPPRFFGVTIRVRS